MPLAFVVFLYGQSLSKTAIHPTGVAGSDYGHAFVDFWFRGHALK